MSVGVSEFVDHAGIRHGLNYAGKPRCGAKMVWSNPPTVGDCRECFPESYAASPDFSSSTLTDLQTAQQERDDALHSADQLRSLLADLRAELTSVCDMREAQHPDATHCSGCAMVALIVADLRRILAAAAPVDGAE